MGKGKWQMANGKWQKAEGKRQKAEGGRRKAEGKRQKAAGKRCDRKGRPGIWVPESGWLLPPGRNLAFRCRKLWMSGSCRPSLATRYEKQARAPPRPNGGARV